MTLDTANNDLIVYYIDNERIDQLLFATLMYLTRKITCLVSYNFNLVFNYMASSYICLHVYTV